MNNTYNRLLDLVLEEFKSSQWVPPKIKPVATKPGPDFRARDVVNNTQRKDLARFNAAQVNRDTAHGANGRHPNGELVRGTEGEQYDKALRAATDTLQKNQGKRARIRQRLASRAAAR